MSKLRSHYEICNFEKLKCVLNMIRPHYEISNFGKLKYMLNMIRHHYEICNFEKTLNNFSNKCNRIQR